MDSLTQQRLSLQRAHCQEWKAFFSDQINLKRLLDKKHRKECSELILLQNNAHNYLAMIRRQNSENVEFKAAYEEKKWRIQKKHEQEDACLLDSDIDQM